MNHNYYVYLLASNKNGTLYIGVTSNLVGRVWKHKNKEYLGFTEKYNVDKLVWYERFDRIEDALNCEKRIKKWNRDWKISLIKKENPNWDDLYLKMVD